MAAPAPSLDWIDQLPRRPGPTPDTEYVQSPADNLWYQVPKAAAPWQPPTAPPAPPPEPGMLERAWDATKQFGTDAASKISYARILHENDLASAGRIAEQVQQSNPDGVAAAGLRGIYQTSPMLSAVAGAMADRTKIIPESASDRATAAQSPTDLASAQSNVDELRNSPGQFAAEVGSNTVEGLKAFARLVQEKPGAAVGSLVQGLGEHPELAVATGDLGATLAGGRIARAAGAGESAVRTAAALGRAAGESTSFGGLMAATEALHEAGDGTIDPKKVVSEGVTGAVTGPAFGAVLRLAAGKPTIRATLDELKKGLDRAPESARVEPALEGPSNGNGNSQGPESPVGGSGGSPTGTLSELLDQARAAGVSPDALQPIMSDRLRRNISDEEARSNVSDLISQAAKVQPGNADLQPSDATSAPVDAPENATDGASAAPTPPESASAPPKKSSTGLTEAFAIGKNGATQDLRDKMWAAHQAGKDAVSGIREPVLAAARAAGVPTNDRGPFNSFVHDYFSGKSTPTAANKPPKQDVAAPVEAPRPDEDGVVHATVAGQPVEVNVEPTELQKASGNYQKGHIEVHGIPITIENPKGTTRSGADADGNAWESTLQHDYGYVKRTLGADGDHVDTFIGPNPESTRVFVVDQHVDGKFDEHKAMLGFKTRAAAVDAYNSNYPAGWKGAKHVTPMSIEQFKDWLKNGDTTQPARGAKLAAAQPAAAVGEGKPAVETVSPADETTRVAEALSATEPGTKPAKGETPAVAPVAPKDLAGAAKPVESPAPAVAARGKSELSADATERLADPAIRDEMRRMAQNAGWAEVGGRIIRGKPDERVTRAAEQSGNLAQMGGLQFEGEVAGRTSWIPREPWFQKQDERLGKNDREYPAVVEDAIAEKPLKAKERRVIEQMTEHAERHIKGDVHEDDLADEAIARHEHAESEGYETEAAREAYHRHLEELAHADQESEASIDAIARREAQGESGREDSGQETARGDESAHGSAPARSEEAGREARTGDEPAAPGGRDTDLFGQDTRRAQELADETRRRDAARNSGQDSLESGRPDDLFSQARQQTDLVDQAAPKKKTLRETIAQRKARESEERRATFFTPGNIVSGYGNTLDRVIAYHPPHGDERWSVDVQEVKKVDGKWVDVGAWVRNHSTLPSGRDRVVERAPAPASDDTAELPPVSEDAVPKDENGKPLFKRGTLSIKTNPEVATYLKRLESSLEGYANLQVHDTPKDFGETIEQDVPNDIAGAYTSDDGTLHFIASKLPDVAAAQAIFRHEGFGHLAMERSPDFEKALSMVGKLRELGGQRINALYNEVKARYPEADETTLRKEVIAAMAERGVKNAIVDRAITGVRQVLSRLGMHFNPHEAELRQMIVQAARGLPLEARALSGLDRTSAYQAETALTRGNELAAADALGRILPESDAIDALSLAKREGDTEAIELLKELSAPLTDNTAVLAGEPSEEDALRPVEAKIPTDVLFARHAPMDAATRAAMDEVIAPDGRDDLSIKDRMRLAMTAVRNIDGLSLLQKNIDDLASLERYERMLNGGKLKAGESSPTKMARSVRNIASVMTAVMKYGAPEWKDGAFQIVPGRKGLLDIFRPLTENPAGNLTKHFGFYAAARRASRLINEQNIDGTLREKNFDAAKIKAGLDLAKKYPELKKVFEDYQKFNGHILDLGEQAGTIDPAARAIYDKHDYVPFYRAEDTISGYRRPGSKPTGGIANQREQSGRLKGSADPLRNVVENMVMNTVHLLDGAARSHAMQAIVKLFNGVVLRKEPLAVQAVRVSNEQIVRALKTAGFNVDPNMTPQQIDEWQTFFRRVAPTGPDVVRNMVDGKPEYYRVLDPLLYDALTSWAGTPEWLKKLDAFGWMSGPKRLLTATATITPRFAISNFIRDTMATWLQSNYKIGVVRGAVKGFADSLRGHQDLYEVMMAGGGGGQRYDSDPEAVRKLVQHNLKGRDPTGFLATIVSPAKWWGAWKSIQQAAENANRLREYRRGRKDGKSVAESAFQARDVLDFAMHGSGHVAQFVNRGSPFLNARIQGTYRMARGFRDNWRAYALRGSLVTLATLGLLAINYSNPRYQELPEWEKDMYWHVFAGEHHFRIPRPFELGAIFATLPERMVRGGVHALGMQGGDTPRTSADAAGRMLLDTFAFNPMPQGARPILEQISNYDFFRGQKIVSDTEAGRLPEDQANAYTSPTVQQAASLLPDATPSWFKSPARLEQLIRSYTSSVGATVLDGADRLTRRGLGYGDAPSSPMFGSVLESFVRNGEPTTTKYAEDLRTLTAQADDVFKTVTDYTNKGRMQDARRLMSDNRKLLQLRPLLNQLGKEMRELSAQQSRIIESKYLTADQKRTAIDKLTKQRNDLARKIAPFEDFF